MYSAGFVLALGTAGLLFFNRYANNFMGPAGWQDEEARQGDEDDDLDVL